MNRVIKFRAWDGNEMIKMPLTSIYGLSRFFGFIPEKAPIMQFTGLTDKNGKEIYEGDVVKTVWVSNDPADEMIEVSEVVYKDGAFYTDEYLLSETNEATEIIGNIYENPELLNS